MTFPGEVDTPAPVDSPYDFNRESNKASSTLSEHAMGLARQASQAANSIDTTALIVGGTGLAVGGAATALGEIGLTRAVEPFAKTVLATGYRMLRAHETAEAVLRLPAMPWYKCITPKPVAIGGAVVATLAVGGYELYKNFGQSSK